MRKDTEDRAWRQIVGAGALIALGALAARATRYLLEADTTVDEPGPATEEMLAAAYLSEHEMLWRLILTRQAAHKTALRISVTALVALLTLGLSQPGWEDALLAGPVIGLVSMAMLLRQWQGWTMVTYYLQQRLQPAYFSILQRLGGEDAAGLASPALDYINYVNARSADQSVFHRRMLRLLWLSDNLLPPLLGFFCWMSFVIGNLDKLSHCPYALLVGADLLVTAATLWLYKAFRRWRRSGFSSPATARRGSGMGTGGTPSRDSGSS
jgi:hypothetical protein